MWLLKLDWPWLDAALYEALHLFKTLVNEKTQLQGQEWNLCITLLTKLHNLHYGNQSSRLSPIGVNVRHVGFAELMARAVQGLGVCLEADCQHCKWWHNDRKSGWKLILASRWQRVSYRMEKCDTLKQEVQDITETLTLLVEYIVFLVFLHFLFQEMTIKPKAAFG